MRIKSLILLALAGMFFSCKKSSDQKTTFDGSPTEEFYENTKGQSPISIETSSSLTYSSIDPVINYVPYNGITSYNVTEYGADPNNTDNPEPHNYYNLRLAAPKNFYDSYITIDSMKYYNNGLHFHWPGEHKIDGVIAPMELHISHKNDSGKIAIVAVLIQEGAENPAIQSLIDASPTDSLTTDTVYNFNVASLLPSDVQHYFTYSGSQTGPTINALYNIPTTPYLEGIKYYVYKTPITMSAAQIAQYKAIYSSPNARSLQPIGSRKVLYHN